MNIMYCGDSGIEKGILLSLLSLVKNTKEKLNVYILTAAVDNYKPIKKEFAQTLENAAAQFNNCNVYIFDITENFAHYRPNANINTRFTPLCMLRLFSDNLSDIPDKILYLDTDVLCRKDFSDFYNTDIADYEIAAVPDRYGKWFFGNIFKHDYLNSGVMLLNMANIRKSGLFEKCRVMCRDKKMFMPDQSAINKLAIKKIMPRIYNEQKKISDNTVFRHFTTYFKFFPYFKAVTVKPWNTEDMHAKLNIREFDDIIEIFKRSNLK